ncbi:putative GMC oxidoreductase [Rosellinia necatrix]|uniref:Putative GMC oxidoreductase n=1 Tax=Rosellinia necatrix TaxID=77044 RepID=A0A1S7UJP9_ROSNE|nr:putative GMC oxidoreductase [Rosellinia necatrix]
MKSFSYLALLSAIAPFAEAGVDQNGIDVLIDRVPVQNSFPQTGPTLKAERPGNKSYEYIIVGSGPGGSPLAVNLAKAGHSVLLVDAGGDYGHLREVESPALANPSSERNEVSWGFFTRHYEDETMLVKDRKLTYWTPSGQYYSGVNPPEGSEILGTFYPRYGGLGGCSEHNALVSILPSKNDFNFLRDLLKDDSWDNDNMRKYFEKIENLQYPVPSKEGHGSDGYIDITVDPIGIATQDIKFTAALMGAAKAFGVDIDDLYAAVNSTMATVKAEGTVDPYSELLPLNVSQPIAEALNSILFQDINLVDPERDQKKLFAQLPMHMDNLHYRRSSPRDYVYDTVTAKNADGSKKYKLDVALNTLVTKVTFDKAKSSCGKPKANGIEYLFGESLYRADPRSSLTENTGEPGSVRATKEVIVAGGAFNSPQILKLSGVGPKEELEKFNISVIVDLPGVGKNLQDRLEVSVNANYPTNFTRILACTYLGTEDDPCWAQYVDPNNKGAAKGAYASNQVFAGAFWTSKYSEDGEQDLWIGGFPALFTGFYPGYSANAATADNKTWWSWLVLKAHTHNTAGTVELASANPRDVPVITFRSLYEGLPKEEADKDGLAMVEGMRMAQRFFEEVPDIDGKPEVFWPPKEYETDEDLLEWVKEEAWGHHASCSNKIGTDDDPMAVLDGNFKVRGTRGLRVVDASVFPKIPGTFVVVPIMMISEKASEVILSGH